MINNRLLQDKQRFQDKHCKYTRGQTCREVKRKNWLQGFAFMGEIKDCSSIPGSDTSPFEFIQMMKP